MADDGGLSSFQRRMRAIPVAARDAVRPALERSAQEVVALAKSLAPFEDGDLRESIGWTWGAPPEGSIAIGAVSDGAALSITIYAGNDKAFYARWVEFGTQPHAVGKGSDITAKKKNKQFGAMHPGATAQPFFYPAYRMLRKRNANRIKRAIGKAIKEAK